MTLTADRPLLMIPGPVELDPEIVAAFSIAPPSHQAPDLIESFGAALEHMRRVWMAGADAQPFIIAGSGTLAMEIAAANLIAPGEAALVVNTGYFSDRMAEIVRRLGAAVTHVRAPAVGDAPSLHAVEAALALGDASGRPFKALLATHVDTSTGVRVDAEGLACLAKARGALSIFDGVCATAAEVFRMEAWGADAYLTGSQKAIGLPTGLALLVLSPAAMEARQQRATPPPLYMDLLTWLPVMQAYEARKPSYFATPPTGLIPALELSLRRICERGVEATFQAHQAAADSLRQTWADLGLAMVPVRPVLAANTLSALYFPEGVDASLLGRIKAHGIQVAGGLHPDIKARYFRVGHMGYAISQPAMLQATTDAIRAALAEA